MRYMETVRLTINLGKQKADQIKELVKRGDYPSVSKVFDVAADVLLARELERDAWWAETLRRCDEAEAYPERLLDADTFFQGVREDLAEDEAKHTSA